MGERLVETRPSRYLQPKPKKRSGIPLGWSAGPQAKKIASGRDHITSLFNDAIAVPVYDENPQIWDDVLKALNLRTCYQPAVLKVLTEARWRNKDNPRAYVATAAARQALSMSLLDFTDHAFRRMKKDDGSPAVHDSLAAPCYDEDGEFTQNVLEDPGGHYARTETGAMRYVDGIANDESKEPISDWLTREGEPDTVDWETVAAYATRKPQMAPVLAETLCFRFEQHIGRTRLREAVNDPSKAQELEAAWKWIDRCWHDRIRPLFQMGDPPRSLTRADIAYFPLMVEEGVTLRVDLYTDWNEDERVLLIYPRDSVVAENGVFTVYRIEADSINGAVSRLQDYARLHDPADGLSRMFFHIWPLTPVDQSGVSSTPCLGFVPPGNLIEAIQHHKNMPREPIVRVIEPPC